MDRQAEWRARGRVFVDTSRQSEEAMNRLMMLPLLPALALMVSGCEKDLAIAGPSEAMAQEAPVPTDGQRRAGPGMRVGSPLGSVLQQREALGLTEAQVTRLESIAERLR